MSMEYRASPGTNNRDFIYNATKAEPGHVSHYIREEDDTNRQSHLFPGGQELDERLSMLLASLPDIIPSADNPEERMRARLQEGRSKTLSDSWAVSKTNDSLSSVFKDAKARIGGLRRWGHGRVISFSEADSGTKRPRWVLNFISPVQPFLPKYPPPERSPTPPGLPTFGTPEAINYATQFDVQSSLPNGPTTTGTASSRRGTESYSHMLRRVFGLSSSSSSSSSNTPHPTSQTDRRHGCVVARAEDGTAVLGRFPYRASGHGTNLNRNLEDHPFHQGQSGIASLDDRNRSNRRYSSARNSIQHAARFSRQRFSAVLPLVPEPAASVSPSRLSASPSANPTRLTTYDGEAGAGARGNGNRAYTGLTFPLQLPSPSRAQTDTGTYNLTRYFWDGYAVLTQYIPCCSCCIVPTDDMFAGSVDGVDGVSLGPGSGSGPGRGSGDCSRTSDETFVTAVERYNSVRVSRFAGLDSLRWSIVGQPA